MAKILRSEIGKRKFEKLRKIPFSKRTGIIRRLVCAIRRKNNPNASVRWD